MRRLIFSIAILLGATGLTKTAQAEEVYICDVTSYSQIGWISPKIVLIFSSDRKEAWVFDGFIDEMHGDPIRAKLKERNSHMLEFRWELKDVPYSVGIGSDSPQYKATLNLKRMIVNESVVLPGMDEAMLRGKGKCQPYTGKN